MEQDKAIVWLSPTIKTPPFSQDARLLAGQKLREIQRGGDLAAPFFKPMPSIGRRVHELKVPDGKRDWRIVFRLDADAIVIADVFEKRGRKTPRAAIATVRKRLITYDEATK